MTHIVHPVAIVQASRKAPEDDWWGGSSARIVIVNTLPTDALAALTPFLMSRFCSFSMKCHSKSHLWRAPSALQPTLASAWNLCAARQRPAKSDR